MKYLLAGTRLVLMVFLILLTYLCYRIFLLFWDHNNSRGYKIRRIFLKIALPILGIKIDVKGKAETKPALYICNHKGLLDFFITLRYVDAMILSKASVRNYPIFGKAAGYTGVFWVDRENKESRGSARKAIIEILDMGENVFIFPEGTTYIGQTTMEFKLGSFQEAAKHGYPVVPVALEYKSQRDYWKNISEIQMFFSQFGKLFTRCKLTYGAPLTAYEDGEKLCQDARNWVDNELLEMQKDWSEVWTTKN